MRVAITGATGLIGAALSEALRERGDEVVGISRSRKPGVVRIIWDPEAGFERSDALSGFDAVVNLAGESIAGRWSAAKKARIRDSRVHGTHTVVDAIARASPRPRILINASAVGLYGDRGDEILAEGSEPGEDFLAEVTRAWEASARAVEQLEDPGVRLCLARFGVVLDAEGGALAKMITPFRLGLGGKIGGGDQWMAWVHRRDVVDALLFMLDHDDARGPFNVVAPNPVRNAEFTDVLARVLHRPTLLPLPKLAVRVALGQMGEALLLHGQRAAPMRLLEAGFEFRYPELEPAVRELLAPDR